jgi:hypothetical protein
MIAKNFFIFFRSIFDEEVKNVDGQSNICK